MATYLYCVLAPRRNEEVPSGLMGMGGAPVRSLSFGARDEMVAWVSSVDDALLRTTGRALAEQALLHNEIVNAAQRTGRTPAPARYGSRFADDDACIADLARRSAELRATLERIANSVEMPVLLVPIRGAPTADRSLRPVSGEAAAGKRYLEAVRQRTREQHERRVVADREADRLGSSLGRYVRSEVRSMVSNGVMSLSYLVKTADVARYRETLAAYVPSSAFRLVEGEMRAPYSFTALGLDRAGHDSGNRR